MALHPTPENFRAQMAKNMLTRKAVCELIGMNVNQFTNYVNGNVPLTGWAAHNIALGLNYATESRLFNIDERLGLMIPTLGRPPGIHKESPSLELYQRVRRRRRRTQF